MALTIGQAILLGAIHGPAELLPVSSSAHIELVPRLLGWSGYDELDPADRKTFAVALHAGSLGPLLAIGPLPRPAEAVLVTTPGAIAGVLLEDAIERRLGGVRATAAGLLAGAAALLAADTLAAQGRRRRVRLAGAVGVAQAFGLLPGMSRLGMATCAGRFAGLERREALALGRSAGLPLTAGAIVLKAVRLRQTGMTRELRGPLVAGALVAATSTALAAPLARRAPLRGAALWRIALAIAALRQNVR